ncbi:Fic family protein [Aureibacillus halotolerans]|uniref:Fic family protein n=1 Tax=Aureibacillus halotolerans TaxID=1508390 RepID=A0A4R6TUV4_9BACI|nr:Fic family protein [Aureibacillus halotolerans]TDQ34604.1 Fic family protein [Aureibacillus halotolerans]
MNKSNRLPFLPLEWTTETELALYKKVVTAISEMEKLKQKVRYSLVNESFIQLLTLQESVQSTRIEGTQVTFSEMLEDHVDQKEGFERVEVRNYQAALSYGMEVVTAGYPITEKLIRQLHEMLMMNARGSTSASGHYRRIQNFIGPTTQMKDASYIPPEPQLMPEYMTNLERYMNGHAYVAEQNDDTHPLIKSAVVHAQFESIHPFLDGNGRLGRILIVLYMLQSSLIDSPIFFLSEELEKDRFKYYAMLNRVRGIGIGKPDWESWVVFFLDASLRMARQQFEKLDRAETLYKNGLEQLDQPSHKEVWGVLFAEPITTVLKVEEKTNLAATTIRKALSHLVQKQMVYANDQKRNRRYYHYDLIRAMNG